MGSNNKHETQIKSSQVRGGDGRSAVVAILMMIILIVCASKKSSKQIKLQKKIK